MAGRVGEDGGDGGGEVLIGDYAAGFALEDDVARAAVGGDDGGNAAGQGLEDDVAEGVGVGGENEEIHAGVGLGQGFATQDAGEVGLRHALAKLRLFIALADDQEAEVGDLESEELVVNGGEEVDVLFNRQATYEAEDEGGI